MFPEIIPTTDGSNTLFNKELNETYHSVNGALTESLHVFIEAGLQYFHDQYPSIDPVSILEIGFGTGLNAILTFKRSKPMKLNIRYDAVETLPLPVNMIERLAYNSFLEPDENETFMRMHSTRWHELTQISPYFSLHKINKAVQDFVPQKKYHLIFFDAFAPDKQPDMWTELMFVKMHDILLPDGLLVTYSAKGIVKNNLRLAGFDIKRLTGPPGKHHMVRAQKRADKDSVHE